MKVGISLPIRELKDDLGAVKAFAQMADELGYTHLRVPDPVLRPKSGHLLEPLMAYVVGWHAKGLSHLCLRTLGGSLDADGHMAVARQALVELPGVD